MERSTPSTSYLVQVSMYNGAKSLVSWYDHRQYTTVYNKLHDDLSNVRAKVRLNNVTDDWVHGNVICCETYKSSLCLIQPCTLALCERLIRAARSIDLWVEGGNPIRRSLLTSEELMVLMARLIVEILTRYDLSIFDPGWRGWRVVDSSDLCTYAANDSCCSLKPVI